MTNIKKKTLFHKISLSYGPFFIHLLCAMYCIVCEIKLKFKKNSWRNFMVLICYCVPFELD